YFTTLLLSSKVRTSSAGRECQICSNPSDRTRLCPRHRCSGNRQGADDLEHRRGSACPHHYTRLEGSSGDKCDGQRREHQEAGRCLCPQGSPRMQRGLPLKDIHFAPG
ncbi:unnamed protein product, partial [Meganyctiphanes norvegica]